MANTVTIVLNAIDQASGVVNRLMSNLDNGLTRSLGRATLAGNLMTSGVEAGLQALGSLAIKTNQLFKDAVNTQTSVIATSGNIMKLAGYNFSQATSFVEDFQKEMAKVAKDLPGVTEDFASVGRGIMDDVIPAFAGLDGKLDAIERKAALENLKELATWGTLLGKIGNSTPQDTAKDMSNFISKSAGLGELFGNNFFQNNPNVRKSIIKQLTGDENTPLREATAIYKTKTSDELRQVLLKAIQQDKSVIDALTESVDGVFGLITDSLFGLYTGTFGFLRDLDTTKDGNQSALKSINQTLLELFGSDGLFAVAGRTLDVLGIQLADPMKVLSDAANAFGSWVRGVRDILLYFNETKDFGKLKGDFANLFNFNGLGAKLADWVYGIFKSLNNFDWTGFFGFVGVKLAEFVNEVTDFLVNLDWGQMSETARHIGIGLLVGLFEFIDKIDWWKLLVVLPIKVLDAAAGEILQVLFDLLKLVFVEPIKMQFFMMGEILSKTFTIISRYWDKAGRDIMAPLIFLRDKAREFKEFIFNNPFFKPFIQPVAQANQNIKNSTGVDVLAASRNTALSPFFGFLTAGIEGILGAFRGNRAGGQNLSSLFSSIKNEMSNSPAGAGWVVANTSELILNQQQQASLMSRMSGRGGVNINSLNVYTQAKDPQEVARVVVEYINREWQNYSQNNLATAVN